jgi:hypothetical protein
LPSTSKRIDFVISGFGDTGEKNFVIIELKQWKEANSTTADDLVITPYYGGRFSTHPSYQASSYKGFLTDYNESVYNSTLSAYSCAYLHNYTEKNPEPLKDAVYEKYLYETLKTEPVESAVQRSLKTMMEWGDDHNANFAHYFNYVSLNKAVHDIVNGHVSLWVILNTLSGQKMLHKMSDEQLNMIGPAFDVPYWMRKFKDVPADVMLVKEICQEAGIE